MEEQQKCEPDYTAMRDHELLEELGDRADRWAAAFCQIAKTQGHELDEGWMIGWFANAIERSWDVRVNRSIPATTPVLKQNLNKLPS